jgi:hypothetical protein
MYFEEAGFCPDPSHLGGAAGSKTRLTDPQINRCLSGKQFAAVVCTRSKEADEWVAEMEARRQALQ